MTSEAKAALLDIANHGGRSHPGYGPLGPTARELVAEDCIEIQMTTTHGQDYWLAELTPRGRKLV